MKWSLQCEEQERQDCMTERNNRMKKIILLLVEGPTDEEALALIYSRLIKTQDIEFDVLHTDITADEGMTVRYIEEKIQTELEKYLRKNPFIEKNDILKVIQIVDTDGAFVPASLVKQSETGRTEYYDTYIEARNKDRLIRRNISKRGIVFHLSKISQIADVPYEIYYFSRNLEHVLHNIGGDLSDEEKEDLAFEIADMYSGQPEEFLKLLFYSDFHVEGDYEATWAFIMKGGNSLKRYSNMSVFFERLGFNADIESK